MTQEQEIESLKSQINNLQRRLQEAAVFFHKVEKMRYLQKRYFKQGIGLNESKAVEKEVDSEIYSRNSTKKIEQLNLNI